MAGEAGRCADCFAGGFGGVLFLIAIIIFLAGLFAVFNGDAVTGLVMILVAAVPALFAMKIRGKP